MRIRTATLGEPPFNFDIAWAFPAAEREILEAAMQRIDIRSPDQVEEGEQLLDRELAAHGYLWSGTHQDRCRIWRPDFSMTLDFFNDGRQIGVEVEKTEFKRVLHDMLKLLNDSLAFVSRVRYGVLTHPNHYHRS